MTLSQQILTIGIMAVGVMITRFLPFTVFPSEDKTPDFVCYLGRFLPSAVFGMLVVYSIKDVSFLSGYYGVPELTGIASTVVLHVWRRNMLVSIAGGTLVYLLLVNNLHSGG